MRKPVAAFLLVLLLAAAAGAYVFHERQLLAENPLHRQHPFINLAKAIADGSGHLYLIDNAKKTIHKMDAGGKLQFSIESGTAQSGEWYRFNDMAVDDQGRLYAVRTLLDSYGLAVKSEQLVRYGADGSLEAVLFEQDYSDAKENRYRVGGLKNLQLRGGALYFYSDEDDRVSGYRIGPGDAEPVRTTSFRLPAGKYLADIDGFEPGGIYYSTRSGEIYRIERDGASTLVYPLPGLDRTRRNFPESLSLDAKGRLLYVDYSARSISRFDPSSPYIVEELVNERDPAKSGIELSFNRTRISVSENGDILIVDDTKLYVLHADGSFAPEMTAMSYSGRYVLHRWLVWAIAAACLLLLVLAAKLFYYDVLKRRLSIVFKQILVFIPAVAAAMILLSMIIYNTFVAKMERETARELALLAVNGDNLIDGDLLEAISSPLEYRGDTYNLFRQKINTLFENSPDPENHGYYKAVYKVENGTIYRILEDDDDMHMFNPFPATEENVKVIRDGIVVTGGWSDETGNWKYAIAPIRNSAGQIVGIFETDRNMDELIAERKAVMQSIVTNIVLISVGLLLVLLLMTFLQLSSLRKLRNSVIEIAGGRWDTEVHIRTRDEIADLGESVNAMAARIRDYIGKVEALNQAYYRFVPQQFLHCLNKDSILDVQLGDQVEKNMTTLVCNIREFYQLSKRMTPEENFNFVNAFLKRFGPYVRNRNGMVGKYLGAGFMALFPDSTDDALRASIDLRKEIDRYNSHVIGSGYLHVDIGIGLHKGPLRLGIIGEEQRLESSVISDNVNIASILERLTEPLGASILMTESVVMTLADASKFQFRDLGYIQVGGITEPLHLYDVYQGDPDTIRALKDKTKTRFEEAVTYYRVGRFYDAREAFLMVIKANRQDKAAQLYFYLCDEYFRNGTSEDWNGTLSVS